MIRVGLISDTHGRLRPEALKALEGCDLVIHAGDVGPPAIVRSLATLSRTLVVRGNVDHGPWCIDWPETQTVTVEELSVLVVHDVATLDVDPREAGIDVVVFGHSHRPSVERRDGTLWINPGSAGPRRFDLPVTLMILEIDGRNVEVERIDLVPSAASA